MKRIVSYLKIKIVSLKKHHDGDFIIEKSRKLSRYRKKHNKYKNKIVKARTYFFKKKKFKALYIYIFKNDCLIMENFIETFLLGYIYLFPQNSFKEELARTNNMIIY